MCIQSFALVQLLCVIGDHTSYLIPMSKVSPELEDLIWGYHGRFQDEVHEYGITGRQLEDFVAAIESAGCRPMRGRVVLPPEAVVVMMCQIV